MLRRSIFTFLFLALLLGGCGDSADPVVVQQQQNNAPIWTPPDPATLGQQLQQALNARMTLNHVPGAEVGVFTPNGSWTSATGFSNVETQTPISLGQNSAWRSITKSFTVTIVMQLAAEGRVSLDAPVGTYLAGVPNGNTITLRQLAEMRSGLFNYTAAPEFVAELIKDLARPWTDQELLDIAFSHPVNFAPGTEYEYSNTNTIVLGRVAETVTGQSFDTLLRNRILIPLNLQTTVLMTGTQLPAPAVTGYAYDNNLDVFEAVAINATGLSTAGGMAGSFNDLRAWGAALVAGTLLPANLQAQRFQSGPATNGPIYDSYGLGMGEIGQWWGHTGDALGFQAAVFTEPTTGSQIVIMLNAANENHDVPVDITRDFQEILGWPLR